MTVQIITALACLSCSAFVQPLDKNIVDNEQTALELTCVVENNGSTGDIYVKAKLINRMDTSANVHNFVEGCNFNVWYRRRGGSTFMPLTPPGSFLAPDKVKINPGESIDYSTPFPLREGLYEAYCLYLFQGDVSITTGQGELKTGLFNIGE